VERADLMGHVAEDGHDRLGVKGRPVGGDAPDGQPARLQRRAEAAEEGLDVLGGRGAFQDVIGEPLVRAVLDE